MTNVVVDTLADLQRLRSRASGFFAGFIWLHVPILAGMAAYHRTGWIAQGAIAAAFALVASIAARLAPTSLASRISITVALTAMPILLVYDGVGSWQIDYHMYFFAIFAMLVAFCDWRPIVVSATLTAGHHLILDIFDRSAVFPTDGGLQRVTLHAAIVAVECGVLIWIIAQIRALFAASARSRNLAEERLQAAENAAQALAEKAALEAEVAERKRTEERLLHVAFHDDLTGLRSSSYFIDALESALARSARDPSYRFALLFIDLDRFKLVNDSLGHHVGDLLLIGIAERLRAALRPGDTLARMGGDEFTILLDNVAGCSDAVAVAERIGESLAVPFVLAQNEVFGSASIGIADSGTRYDRPEEMLRDADSAMYEAKRSNSGRGASAVYEAAMDVKAWEALQVQHDLRNAVERRELRLFYQPIVRLDTGRIAGFEALVRWQHPQRGLLAPGDFIAIAEETGLILGIGSWVLHEACRQLREWEQRFGPSCLSVMSVNVSNRQLVHPSFARDVDAALAESEIDPRSLQLEITESALIGNVAAVGAVLAGLRKRGVKIAFDDFGTGYSSLSYLQRYRVDTLKIDQSFVRGMEDGITNAEIIKAITALARTLGVDVAAEGVETASQAYTVAALGCSTAQGYYFAKPVAAPKVPAMIETDVESREEALA